jgi:hypothetical protein
MTSWGIILMLWESLLPVGNFIKAKCKDLFLQSSHLRTLDRC